MTDARYVTEQLAGTWHGYYGAAFCPGHENTKTPSLSISNGHDGKLLMYCHAGCLFEDIVEALRDQGILSDEEPPGGDVHSPSSQSVSSSSLEIQSQRAENIWQCAQCIGGTLAEDYLWSRGIKTKDIANLRYAQVCYHPSNELYPAMVGLIQGSEAFAVHCTLLDHVTGGKAAISPNKVMFGAAKGGAVRLLNGSGGLIVAEGIETGLSIQSGNHPPPFSVWAALSTSGMRSLRLPPKPDKLIIASDGDSPGRLAAYDLATRAKALGWTVVLAPAPEGLDWNDVLGNPAPCQ